MWNHLSKSHSWLEAEQEAGLLASWHAAAHTNHFQGFRKTSPWKYHLLKDMGAAQDGSKGFRGWGEKGENQRGGVWESAVTEHLLWARHTVLWVLQTSHLSLQTL